MEELVDLEYIDCVYAYSRCWMFYWMDLVGGVDMWKIILVIMMLFCSAGYGLEVGEMQKIGIMEVEFNGSGWFNKKASYSTVFEVIEIEKKGKYSKIEVHHISGIPERFKEEAEKLIPDWIESSRVNWFVETTRTK